MGGAGLDVITTVNIQHLESIADEVEHMTGARVRERVPDWVVRKANQIELVDSSPEQLRRRMLHRSIYPKDRVPQALAHFFRTDNLIALARRCGESTEGAFLWRDIGFPAGASADLR